MGYSHKNNRRRATKKVSRVVRKRRLPSHLLPPPTSEKYANLALTRYPPSVNQEDIVKLRLGVIPNSDVINAILDQEPTLPRGVVGLKQTNVTIENSTIPKLKQEEIEYLTKLINKYDHDYKKMERDIKLNYLQHTAQHLSTRIQKLDMIKNNTNNTLTK